MSDLEPKRISSSRDNARLGLMPTLLLSMGLLVLVSVSSILALNWITGRSVVDEFATRLIARGLTIQEMALRRHLDAVVDQATFIAAAIGDGRYLFSDPALGDFVSGAIAAAPQIGGLILADSNGNALRVVRGKTNTEFRLDRLDITSDRQLAEVADEIRTRKDSYWGPPVFRAPTQTTSLNYRVPIWKRDLYVGFLAIAVSTRALSKLATELSDPPRSVAFMLYGQDRVLAHRFAIDGSRQQSESTPLLMLRTFGDRVIANFSSLPPLDEAGITPPVGDLARQHTVDGERYFVFAREISGYSDLPITIGVYVLARAVDAPLRLFYWASIIALAMLGVSLIATALMAGAITGPIRRAARGAAAIGTFDFDKVGPLAYSRIREINGLAQSFNAMLDGLRAFGRYVPRTLVTRLIKEGRVGAGTEERKLAIMFTDIVGFTTACENMTAGEVADFINQHLALVSACIEQEDGTIDKFIGDAVMAFWGAPGRVDNPAASACRAATAIQQAIAADNERRVATGFEPVRIRIGVHIGTVIVGDIGAPNRINYTIVGDAVNATQRLESLGKVIDPDAESITLISREIFEMLPDGFHCISRGMHLVKGKHESLDVYQLVDRPKDVARSTVRPSPLVLVVRLGSLASL
ncbi:MULTISPECIES: adenylate/guanylate cyclase domain-containing protein [Bradyrhizobium]|uniref:adenylate/guanylate cyclase domain-containing protein n=1 Tax=Bradyrhizobium TaxID=374 RepID=UPI000A063B2D|nr:MULTISPECIES: adenylate/guanylate cyclase domain-containing protein [Bradyrhizobium]QOG20191.1 HAMP domain-containing protein [Bradyrhizobium sp. SEMIA]UFW52516.1 adenylate/guanylate cyclase domain-containing protein [Bradyrhizobium arachidis]